MINSHSRPSPPSPMTSSKTNLCTFTTIQKHQKEAQCLLHQKLAGNDCSKGRGHPTSGQTLTSTPVPTQNNIAYENEAQMQLRELQQLSLQLHSKIEGEIVQRKQKENQLVQTMERKLKLLRGEIEKEKKERTEIMEQITNTLKNDVPSLMNEVIDSGKARQDEEDKLAEIIEGQIAECQEQTAQFREKQEENCSKVYGLIRELTLKAKKEVEEEKAVREQTHDEILSYVEETCNKLGE